MFEKEQLMGVDIYFIAVVSRQPHFLKPFMNSLSTEQSGPQYIVYRSAEIGMQQGPV